MNNGKKINDGGMLFMACQVPKLCFDGGDGRELARALGCLKLRISGSGLGLELEWFSVYVALGA